jgi:Cache 3/Cache 2 fusion domain
VIVFLLFDSVNGGEPLGIALNIMLLTIILIILLTTFIWSLPAAQSKATNMKKEDGSRALGTILDPSGKVIAKIHGNKAFYGEANILGNAYITGDEPVRDAASKVVRVYCVGLKR